eukprot:317563-Chlamydomonas_euryale.AAC.1
MSFVKRLPWPHARIHVLLSGVVKTGSHTKSTNWESGEVASANAARAPHVASVGGGGAVGPGT